MAKTQSYNADSITVLEGLEPVRTRPGMYIGGVGSEGLNHLVYEILDNSVDEHLAGYCTEIRVTLEKDGSCTVQDNGRGLPVDMHQKGVSAERVIMTTLHAGGKFDNQAYKTSGGLHGVGSSVVNALSSQMTVEVARDGKIYRDSYSRGIPTTELINGLLPVVGKTKQTGTRINFTPDDTIFEKTVFKSEWIKSRLHETAYLNPELTIYFRDLRVFSAPKVHQDLLVAGDDGQISFGLDALSTATSDEAFEQQKGSATDSAAELSSDGAGETIVYHEPDGLRAYITALNKGQETVTPLIYFKDRSGDTEVECCFQYVDAFEENIH